jgi:hypothetical protein
LEPPEALIARPKENQNTNEANLRALHLWPHFMFDSFVHLAARLGVAFCLLHVRLFTDEIYEKPARR